MCGTGESIGTAAYSKRFSKNFFQKPASGNGRSRFREGDPNEQSPKDRGLTFEMILEAIENGGLLDVLPDAAHPGQVVPAVRVGGYVHAVPCEFRGEDLRMITAFPSRKLQKI